MADSEVTKAVATVEKVDNGKPALYNPAAFDQIYRAARLFASSDLVPAAYKGKPENCFIAIEMADRLGINPFAVLQSLVIIQGKPAMEAKLITALVNDSGMFVDPLEYEIIGDDAFAMDYKVRCFATMRRTGKVCLGPWIDYRMVKGEGWLDKGGSKWKTIPSLMFMYRAASFFAKVYCSNITMGMNTREEMEDSRTPVDVTPAPDLAGLARVEHKSVQALQAEQSRPHPDAIITEHTEVLEGKPAQATPAAATISEAPKRERGKPSPGRQRRTKEEMAEDEASDAADHQRGQAAAEKECPACIHPCASIDQETGRETCDTCGAVLDEPESYDFPDLSEDPKQPTDKMVTDTLGTGSVQQPANQQPAGAVDMADLF